MSSTLVKIGTGLSFFNTAWLVGLSGWLWSVIPSLTKSYEEMEEVIVEMEAEVETVEKMRDEISGFQLSLDEVEARLRDLEGQYKVSRDETKKSFYLIFQELSQAGIDVQINDEIHENHNMYTSNKQQTHVGFAGRSDSFTGVTSPQTQHMARDQNTSSRRGARGGRGGRGRGARGGSSSTRDKIDEDIEFLASLED